MDATDTSRAASSVDAASANRRLAVWVVLGGGVAALVLGSAAMWLVREQLHINCSMGEHGSEGADTWTCNDGVGYVAVAALLGAMWLSVTVGGALVAGLVHRERVARVVLLVLAAMSAAWILSLTRYGSSELVHDLYAPMSGEQYWQLAVGPAAIVIGIGLTVAALGLFVRRRLAVIATMAAAVTLIAATVLQPGLGIGTVPAAGLLAAAAVRAAATR